MGTAPIEKVIALIEQDSYVPTDLDKDSRFFPGELQKRPLILVPSGNIPGADILSINRSRLLFDQRQEAVAASSNLNPKNLFVTYLPIPPEEDEYRDQLFGDERPIHKTIHNKAIPMDESHIVPTLARQLLSSKKLMSEIRSLPNISEYQLMGYLPSKEMSLLAEELKISYLGSPDFYHKSGNKIGLLEFANRYSIPTPDSHAVESNADTAPALEALLRKGYSQAVLKASVSQGGYGYQLVDLKAAEEVGFELRGIGIHPPSQPYLAQGWFSGDYIDSMVSIDILVNGEAVFMHTKTRVYSARPFNYGNPTYLPISKTNLRNLMPVAKKLTAAYMEEQAIGPHCANFIFPSTKACKLLGFKHGTPLIHDENTRIGAGYMAHCWVRWLQQGVGGTGWVMRSLKMNPRYDLGTVLSKLSREKLLVESRAPGIDGVFLYNGVTQGHIDAIAIAKDGETRSALDLIVAAQEVIQ